MLRCARREPTAAAAAATRRRTVLVVDDDEMVRESLALALELEGYATVRACDGIDALLALRTGARPDVILLDLEMPLMPGWEFRERQLADPDLATIPVVVVSSSPRAVSADRRLQKPFDLDALLRVVRELGGPAVVV
jgi:CheY-like chemotaxis protein